MFTVEQLQTAHSKVKSGADFLTFIKMCASAGIEKWEINMEKMTCTYFNKTGNEILIEQIPQ